MSDIDKRLNAIRDAVVLCIGDVMLDRYVYGEVSRISPEAPVQVLAAQREECAPGGVGNVALNIAGLGGRCVLVGVIGDDLTGRMLTAFFAGSGSRVEAHLALDTTRPTTSKVRFVSEQFSSHLLRVDWELPQPIDSAREREILALAKKALKRCGAMVISDYGKGTLTPGLIAGLIKAAKTANKPVVIDPKGLDYRIYRGATVVTPNRAELSLAVRREVRTAKEIATAAAELARSAQVDAILATRSEQGMTLQVRNAEPVHIEAHPTRVRDVSGAGDTVVATMAAMLAVGADLESAARAANAAGAVAVSKRGTAAVSSGELRARLLPSVLRAREKIAFDRELLNYWLQEWREAGLRIGFSNGVFDLLHPGHIKVLAEARAACDRLIVGINTDASVRRLKGPSRPLQDERSRAEVLAALEVVDLVVPFDKDTPLELIRTVKPQVLVKGADYKKTEVVGRDVVERAGGKVLLVELLPAHSTTRLVERAQPTGRKKRR